ncbi:golgin subfamily A member 6-like protein 22 [Belonocnema kinseyi]|uniref:golgin subfamily A member 6-like protein 22 n=1 Tax=Belonocnema kinseyi TaxID=2817044 RepID=UPI00143D384B|nr:golgin subfamily A member 6-like protein 22 [Belonocnema kinseyi]
MPKSSSDATREEEKVTDEREPDLTTENSKTSGNTQNVKTAPERRGRGRPKKLTEPETSNRSQSLDTYVKRARRGSQTEESAGKDKNQQPEPEEKLLSTLQKNTLLKQRDNQEQREMEETEETRKKTDRELLLLIMSDLKEIRAEKERSREENQKELQTVKNELQRKYEEWEKEKTNIYKKIQVLELKIENEEWVSKKEDIDEKMKQIQTDLKKKAESGQKRVQNENFEAQQMSELEKKLEKWEKRERKNNIVVRGLQRENSAIERARLFLEENIKVDGRIKEAYEIGREENNKVLVIKLETWEMKRKILERKPNLKGTSIFVDDDLTKSEREVQRKIREVARRERENGKEVKVGYRKIKINDKWIHWNEEEGKLTEKYFL